MLLSLFVIEKKFTGVNITEVPCVGLQAWSAHFRAFGSFVASNVGVRIVVAYCFRKWECCVCV